MDRLALGRYLRESREARELSLDDVVRVSKIRRGILESFEQGNFDVAESQVQIRGLLRNYAHHLGLDEDRVIQYYTAAINPPRRRARRRGGKRETDTFQQAPSSKITDTPPAMPPVTLAEQRNRRRDRTGGILRTALLGIGALISIGVIVFVVLDSARIPEQIESAQQTAVAQMTEEASPVGAEADAVTMAESEPVTLPTETPTETPTPGGEIAAIGQGVNLQIRPIQRSWVSVTVDGQLRYTGVVVPGTVVTYEGNTSAELMIANANALLITFNGADLPSLGDRTQSAQVTFTQTTYDVSVSEPVIGEPTNTLTPTPTMTLTVGPTNTVTPLSPELAGQPTPTLLFGVVEPEQPLPPTAPPSPTVEGAQGGNPSVESAPQGQTAGDASPTPLVLESPTPTLSPTATESPTPSPSPTSDAVLPPRETPSDLPPVKGA